MPSGDKFAVYLSCGNLSNQYVQTVSQAVIPPGQWTHLAGSITSDGLARIYVGGKAVAEKPLGGKIKFSSWYNAISVGNYGNGGDVFAGDLAGIRWRSRAADDAEIVAAAAAGPNKP